jgi:hypothetical protein
MFMKMLVGEAASKAKDRHDEPPLGIDTGDVFRSLGVLPLSGPTVSSNLTKLNCPIGTSELTVRPVLSNFLGRLHGGALAMSIEHTARMHARRMRGQSDGQSSSNSEGWIDGADTNPGPGADLGSVPPTIVRMEITYKASMTSALEITCSHDASAGFSDQEDADTGSDSDKFASNPFRIAGRRSSGEVFNRTVEGPSPSRNSDGGSGGKEKGKGLESSATYTCYWSS